MGEVPEEEDEVTVDEEDLFDEQEDEELVMGRAVIRAAADALAKVEEAEQVLARFDVLAGENATLARKVEELSVTGGEAALALQARIDQLEAENARLSRELKKRAGNSIGSRMSGEERQAMTRLMKELKRKV